MGKKNEINWDKSAAEDDYKAARRYLGLLFTRAEADRLVKQLRSAPTEQFAAKDLLRASQTHLLDKKNAQVRRALKEIREGKKLSPVLLVRGNGHNGTTLTIADGYHRICATWHWDEKCPVHCCLVDLPTSRRKE